MDRSLKRIICDPECGFMVQSHDEEELVEIAKKHAKTMHDMEASDEEIRAMVETV
ncbi:DUF1059 domain-containing protein [Candidatus Microgenomates bacterium]|nr:DUF1059 domain-containing protein [Candidatus Microgenomates bacterium]